MDLIIVQLMAINFIVDIQAEDVFKKYAFDHVDFNFKASEEISVFEIEMRLDPENILEFGAEDNIQLHINQTNGEGSKCWNVMEERPQTEKGDLVWTLAIKPCLSFFVRLRSTKGECIEKHFHPRNIEGNRFEDEAHDLYKYCYGNLTSLHETHHNSTCPEKKDLCLKIHWQQDEDNDEEISLILVILGHILSIISCCFCVIGMCICKKHKTTAGQVHEQWCFR